MLSNHKRPKQNILTQSKLVSANQSLLEVDRLLIYTNQGASTISILQEFGLYSSDQIIKNPEQGTASAIFLFENMYLELVWIDDLNAAVQSSQKTGINLVNRVCWQETGASPFAIGLRSKTNTKKLSLNEFSKKSPDQLLQFSNKNLENESEPICFVVSQALALSNWLDYDNPAHQKLLKHPSGVRKISNICLGVKSPQQLSSSVSLLKNNNVIQLEEGKEPLLELTFDHDRKGETFDIRSVLPILLKF